MTKKQKRIIAIASAMAEKIIEQNGPQSRDRVINQIVVRTHQEPEFRAENHSHTFSFRSFQNQGLRGSV